MVERAPWERNLRMYTWFLGCRETYMWLPMFFLYFSAHLPLDEVLRLEAAYYAAVVLFEVPSGYTSDRWGRRKTLLLSSAAMFLAYVTFALAPQAGHWSAFLVAQILLAAGIAFSSGTDTSLHYETLEALELEDYGEREAKLSRLSSWSTAIGALVGGAVAMVNMSWVYGLSAALALGMLGSAWRMTEPPHEESEEDFTGQLRACAAKLREPALAWLFGVATVGIMVNHIPYEWYQSYLDVLWGASQATPLIAGAHTTAVALVAGWGAAYAMVVSRRVGLRAHLLGALGAQLGLVMLMGFVLHPIVAVLMVGRGLPGVMVRAPLRDALQHHLPSRIRATYLSLQSLAGRLGYALLLLGMSQVAAKKVDADNLSATLMVGAGIICVLWLFLALWRPREDNLADASASR